MTPNEIRLLIDEAETDKDANRIIEEYGEQFKAGAEYWKQRCLLAEKFIEESPCDPDITEGQIKAHQAYNEYLINNAKQ